MFFKIGPICREKYVTVVLSIPFLFLALCQLSLPCFVWLLGMIWGYYYFYLPIVHLLQSSVLTDMIFFFSFLALSLEVNSFFSLCEDFLSGAFVCVTISSFLNTTLASSEPLSYLLPCHPQSHLKSCRRWQITQSPAVLQRLRFWLKSCLFLTDTSLSPRRVWWLWMAEGKVSQGLYDAFISK